MLEAHGVPFGDEVAAFVHHQGGSRGPVVPVQAGQEAHAGEDLEAIADAHDEMAVVYKLAERLAQQVFNAAGEDQAGAHMVSEGEAADEHQALIGGQLSGPGQQVVEVHEVGGGPGALPGELRLSLAVESISGDDENAGRAHYKLRRGLRYEVLRESTSASMLTRAESL